VKAAITGNGFRLIELPETARAISYSFVSAVPGSCYCGLIPSRNPASQPDREGCAAGAEDQYGGIDM
jgi:hypothetical protein